jgi:hypothetical protein
MTTRAARRAVWVPPGAYRAERAVTLALLAAIAIVFTGSIS